MRHLSALALLAGGLALAPGQAAAQVRPPPSRPTPTPTRDTVAVQRELVQWAEMDSVMRALLARQDMSATRYQADEVEFVARGRGIILNGNAAVQRDESIIVSDTILYSDSTKIVIALGDTAVLRDPAQGPADVIALGRIAYDIANRRGVVTNVSTSVESGETWYLSAKRSFFQGDSANVTEQRFYARNGTLTSCSDVEHPDYYFKAKEIKLVQKRLLVARPAVLYIEDVPVAWLPFIFQDLRSGRRSGILPPRIGVSDIVRNNPNYQRRVENIGYYWAMSDYADASAWMDWQSGARTGFGFARYNAETNYRWLDRFLSGRLAYARINSSGLGGSSHSDNYSWAHQQSFSDDTRFNADVNYSTNANSARRTQTNAYAQLATIRSSANLTTALGPARIALGGTRNEVLSGLVTTALPTLNVSTGTINVAPWLAWTPSLSVSNQLQSNVTSGLDFPFSFRPGGDSLGRRGATRNSTLAFQTPFTIRDYAIGLDFAVSDFTSNVPSMAQVFGSADTTRRVFARSFETTVDWNFSFGLPRFSQGRWNIAPSVGFTNQTGGAFFLRNEVTGGRFVSQGKRIQASISSTPTFFGLFPGFAGFSRFRHAISPSITYSWAPAGNPSDAYLIATGRNPARTDLSSIRQNQLTIGVATNLEGKVRAETDSAEQEGAGEKIRVLSVNMDGVGYNFEQVRQLRQLGRSPKWIAGLTTDRWGYRLSSDLLPGASFGARYSLFEGDIRSDTAKYSPFLEGIEASFQINRRSSIFAALTRVFGKPIKNENPIQEQVEPSAQDRYAQQVAAQPIAGSSSRRSEFSMPDTRAGWNASITFSQSRSRPVVGATVIDPLAVCRTLTGFAYDACIITQRTIAPDSIIQSSASRQIIVSPPRTNLSANTSFKITERWAAQWSTNYDFEANDGKGGFGSQIVSLRRELHDWDAVFGFTKGPTGAFSFTAFIQLRAQPDLKFDYRRNELR